MDLRFPFGLNAFWMTIKESYDITGSPTTWGIPAFADNIAQSESHAVRDFRLAGADQVRQF